MTIRFLDLVESDAPGFPFLPGQTIDVPEMTPVMRAAVRSGRAELVRGEESEHAIADEARERAVIRRRTRKVLA